MAKVSFSQYSMWSSCPQQYKLNYIDKLGESSGNIHTLFGSSMHETIQHYLSVMYGVSKKQADEIDLDRLLLDRMKENFTKEKEALSEGTPCTQIELEEFYGDGRRILTWFKKYCSKFYSKSGYELEVWGDGQQTRSFLYVDECVEAVLRLMESNFTGPVNIGSEEMVTINELAQLAIDLSEKDIKIKNIEGTEFKTKYGFTCPVGVRGRNSDNKLYKEKVGWESKFTLKEGMEKTYKWINEQVQKKRNEQVYIYESPDKGKTVYRREFMDTKTRELVTDNS